MTIALRDFGGKRFKSNVFIIIIILIEMKWLKFDEVIAIVVILINERLFRDIRV